MKLVLVESPTKARTLSRFLGKDYRIEATFGHLRDLPKGELGVDVEKNFTPKYVIPRDKSKRVKELRTLVKDDIKVVLATDPDREGEAIAYHMAVILSQEGAKIKNETIDENKFERITFHEITEDAIKEALTHSGSLNIPLVNAQQARRVLDRLVGYKLSPMLWKKLSRRWLSAGRVQSIALRLIVEREREIERFNLQEYWVIYSQFVARSTQKQIESELKSKDGIKYETSETLKLFDGSYSYTKSTISNETHAKQIIADWQTPYTVSAVDKKEVKRYPGPPYTTSAMQIDAGKRLGFTARRTMRAAQLLYEKGLITYHRTDSVVLSTKFLGQAKVYIEKTYGNNYSHYRTYTTKSKLAQEAHEAIRPTNIYASPEHLKSGDTTLRSDHTKLYELIWKRALASQMTEAIFDSTTIRITTPNGYLFETQGSVVKFDGFLKVMGRDSEVKEVPDVRVGETLDLAESLPQQKFTTPPPRYSEASLIKALEEDGIGRPSTYAPTLSTIQERQYVAKETKPDGRTGRNFVPTELGLLVNDFLVAYFPDIVNLPFTANMEGELDEIAEGKREWIPVISEFYKPFSEKLRHVEETVQKVEAPVEKTGEVCPECKLGEVIIKLGRYGKFMACSRFPDCKYTKNIVVKIDMRCPKCSQGDVIVKKTKRGRIFYGCSRYPDCNFASWTKPKLPPPSVS